MTSILMNNPAFVQMLEQLRLIGGGPSGPPIEGRLLAGAIANGLGMLPVGGGLNAETAYFDMITIRGKSTTLVNGAYKDLFRKHLHAGQDDWPNFFKHLLWDVVTATTSQVVASGRKFAAYDDLINLIKAQVPSSGGTFMESVYVLGYDLVDTTDTYPQIRRARNSMFSSFRGRTRHHVRISNETYGMATGWETWYADAGRINQATLVNWHGNVARNLVRSVLAVDPGSSNENAVWAAWGKRTRWNMPKIGKGVYVASGSSRGAVWDNVGAAWITPPAVPVGLYEFQQPWLIFDLRGQGSLDTRDMSGNLLGNHFAVSNIAVAAFPVVNIGRYYAFVLYPFGADTWFTEYLDPSKYDLLVRTNFRHERQAQYHVVPVTQHNGTAESMFNIWKPDKSGTCQLWNIPGSQPWWARANIDNDGMPTGFDMCRRDKLTGIRSPFVPLFKVRRRLPNANSRIDPAFL